MFMELLQQIEDLVNGKATIVADRIMVEFTGIKNASELKRFMHKNGFYDVYGAYADGVYTLGFSDGELY